MIGTVLQNRYRLDVELGQGGMGAVYRAHDLLLERAVAIKILRIGGSELGSQGRARLLNEAKAVARLHHPQPAASRQPAGAVPALLLSGEPGIGKTRLVRELYAGLSGLLL